MVFIIGGSYQGKTECAFRRMRNQDKKESEIGAEAFSVFDARNMKKSEKLEALPETERRQALNARRQVFQEISDSQTVLHLELLVRRLMEQDSETENWEEELFSALQSQQTRLDTESYRLIILSALIGKKKGGSASVWLPVQGKYSELYAVWRRG